MPKRPVKTLSQAFKQELNEAFSRVEPIRRKNYTWLISLFVYGFLAAPILFFLLILAAKYGYLWWLSWFGKILPSGNHRATRGLVQLIGVALVGMVQYILFLFRRGFRQALNQHVLPLVCRELNLEHLPEKSFTKKHARSTFARGLVALNNPLSLRGSWDSINFTAHVIDAKTYKERTNLEIMLDGKRIPPLVPVFEGLLICIDLPKPHALKLLVHAKNIPIKNDELKPVALNHVDFSHTMLAWSNQPRRAKAFLQPDFLRDINAVEAERPNDLPPLCWHLNGAQLFIYLPDTIASWYLSHRLSLSLGNDFIVETMLGHWEQLKLYLRAIKRWHPELFN